MTTNSQIKSLLFKTCSRIYPKKLKSKNLYLPKDKSAIINFIRENRIIHALSDWYLDAFLDDKVMYYLFRQFKEESDLFQRQINDAIKQLLFQTKKPFAVIKTFSVYPHTASDVDIVTKDENEEKKIKTWLSKQRVENTLTTDVSHKVSWTDSEEVSPVFFWKNITKKTIKGQTIIVPNNDLDVLIRLAHIPFELSLIRLGELMHIFQVSKRVDWNRLKNEAKKNGWEQTFVRMTALLN